MKDHPVVETLLRQGHKVLDGLRCRVVQKFNLNDAGGRLNLGGCHSISPLWRRATWSAGADDVQSLPANDQLRGPATARRG